jgi:hypothetical protein
MPSWGQDYGIWHGLVTTPRPPNVLPRTRTEQAPMFVRRLSNSRSGKEPGLGPPGLSRPSPASRQQMGGLPSPEPVTVKFVTLEFTTALMATATSPT